MRIDIPGRGPILFEGEELSDCAKLFEITPGFKTAPTDIVKSILDLHYAWARTRSSESTAILKMCDWLEADAFANKIVLQQNLKKYWPDDDSGELLQDWLLTILTIRKIAEARSDCSWTIEPIPGEARNFIKPCLSIIRTTQAIHKKQAFSEEFLAGIESAAEAEQIRFIKLVVDSYSD